MMKILLEMIGPVAVVLYALMVITTIIAICNVALGGMVIALLFALAGTLASIAHTLR